MNKITYKKFNLGKPILLENGHKKIYIPDLKEIYDSHGYPTSGLVDLLLNPEYPGYCQLYIKNGDSAYTKDGDFILIKITTEILSVVFTHDPDSFKRIGGKTESVKDGYLFI